MTTITGYTYPIRRELRDLGGTWDAAKQCWYVPDDRAGEAKALVSVGRARWRRVGSKARIWRMGARERRQFCE